MEPIELRSDLIKTAASCGLLLGLLLVLAWADVVSFLVERL